MDRIENVDLREALREIAERNTFSHLDNDINITFDQIDRALKQGDPAEKSLIFIAYPSGIDSYTEREVFQKDTRGYNGVMFHGFDMQRDLKLTYAVQITGSEDGAARGNIFEIDIRNYTENVRTAAVVSNEMRLYLADENGGEIVMPKAEFDRRYPLDLPKMDYWRHEPADLAALQSLLDKAQKERETNSEPRSLWAHTSDLYDNRFTFYADQIMRDLGKLEKPNGTDGLSFTAPLNSIIAHNFNPEQLSRLLDALPYKEAAFSVRKGEHSMSIVVPRDEVLLDRHKQKGELTVNRDGQESSVNTPTKEREQSDKAEKPSILEALKQGAEKSKQQSGHKTEYKKSKEMEM